MSQLQSSWRAYCTAPVRLCSSQLRVRSLCNQLLLRSSMDKIETMQICPVHNGVPGIFWWPKMSFYKDHHVLNLVIFSAVLLCTEPS